MLSFKVFCLLIANLLRKGREKPFGFTYRISQSKGMTIQGGPKFFNHPGKFPVWKAVVIFLFGTRAKKH